MRRPQARRILILAAALHLLSDAALAGGMVFCVGPDDHRAVEMEHVAASGCESSKPTSEGASLEAAPEDCSDSPLHPEADIAAGNQDRSDLSLTLLLLPSPFPVTRALDRRVMRAHSRAPDFAPSVLAQRTTVLRL